MSCCGGTAATGRFGISVLSDALGSLSGGDHVTAADGDDAQVRASIGERRGHPPECHAAGAHAQQSACVATASGGHPLSPPAAERPEFRPLGDEGVAAALRLLGSTRESVRQSFVCTLEWPACWGTSGRPANARLPWPAAGKRGSDKSARSSGWCSTAVQVSALAVTRLLCCGRKAVARHRSPRRLQRCSPVNPSSWFVPSPRPRMRN